MISFHCSNCGVGLNFDEKKIKSQSLVAESLRCPKCDGPMVPVQLEEKKREDIVERQGSGTELESSYEYYPEPNKTNTLVIAAAIAGSFAVVIGIFLIMSYKSHEASQQKKEHPKRPETNARPPAYIPPVVITPRPAPSPSVEDPEPDLRPPIMPKSSSVVPMEKPAGPKPSPKVEIEDDQIRIPPPPTAKAPETKESDEKSKALLRTLGKSLKSPNITDRINACNAIMELGEKARPATRLLCEAILDNNPKVRLAASDALEKVNPNLHAVAVPLIIDKAVEQRIEALRKLHTMSGDASPAIPLVLWYGQHQQDGAGLLVVKTLSAIGASDPLVTRQFSIALLNDKEPLIRKEIAKSLPMMAGAKQYVNSLSQSARSDRDDGVRIASIIALGDIGPDAKSAVKILKQLKTDSSAGVRDAAAKSLARIETEE